MSYWPAALPAPAIGYKSQSANTTLSTSGDIAPTERSVDHGVRETVDASWNLSGDRFFIFAAWYRWRAMNGVAWFDHSWDGRKGRAQFVRHWQAQLSDNRWQVSAQLELRYEPG